MRSTFASHGRRAWFRLWVGWFCLLPVWAAAAEGPGWDPRLVRALLRLEQLPSDSCGARWRLADSTTAKGWVRWGETLSDATNQARLDEWLAAAPGRHLPRLGEPVRVLNRYDTGKPLSGAFLGFDGPILVLAQQGNRPDLHLEWEDLQAVDGAGRPLAGLVGNPADWPPTRRPLILAGPAGPRSAWPHQVDGLDLREWTLGDTMFLSLWPLGAAGVYLVGRAFGESVWPSE